MKKLIQVTEFHIAQGERCGHNTCAIALAVKEQSASFMAVGQDGISFWKDKENKEFQIPDSARKFIQDFDAGLRVFPFSFDLDIPDEYFNN